MKRFPKASAVTKTLAFVFACAALVLVSSLSAFGQATTGTLRGTVADPNGGQVAGATVTVKNDATGTVTPTTTNGEGIYVVPNLLPGTYTVTIEAAGFSKKVITEVKVSLGEASN